MHKVWGEARSLHTFQQSHDAHVFCSDFSALDCELQVHKFVTGNATAVDSISGSREFLVTASRSDFILFRHFYNSRSQAHGGASCMNFGNCEQRDQKPSHQQRGNRRKNANHTFLQNFSACNLASPRWYHRVQPAPGRTSPKFGL